MTDGTSIVAGPPALSPERLRAFATEAWKLLPVPRDERKDLLRDEAAELVDRLLVQVARASGAIAVAMGECMAALCSGDGTMRLGYSGVGDYAREELSLSPRTALEMMKLAHDLQSRPLLREAVRSGAVSTKQAEAVVRVAVGEAEAGWVERAKKETVRSLLAAVRGGEAAGVEGKDEAWQRVTLGISPVDREDVDHALGLAGKLLGHAAPRWERSEAICQEYVGHHPVIPEEERERERLQAQEETRRILDGFMGERAPDTDARAWLEKEYDRWSFLYKPDQVPAPEPGVDDTTRARRIDRRLRELAAMRDGWDELVGHLSLLVLNTGLWRDMQYANPDHYATERLGMSGRAMEQRAWLERRMWDLPAIRKAMREGRIGYEQARLVARCKDPQFVEGWIAMAESMTCIAFKRAVEADEERQMCARDELRLVMPERVMPLFRDACRAVNEVEKRWVPTAEAFVIMCRHFIEVWEEALKEKNTSSRRVRERDGGWCTVPGCSRVAANVHHIRYRSQGGGEEESNKTTPCGAHHHHGIHKGYVRVSGEAPDDLVWVLGEEDDEED